MGLRRISAIPSSQSAFVLAKTKKIAAGALMLLPIRLQKSLKPKPKKLTVLAPKVVAKHASREQRLTQLLASIKNGSYEVSHGGGRKIVLDNESIDFLILLIEADQPSSIKYLS